MLQLSFPGGSASLRVHMKKDSLSDGNPLEFNDRDYQQADLNQLLAPHQGATFVMEAGTDLMLEAGIRKGDLLVVDRTVAVANGNVVVALVKGTLIIRRYEEVKKSVRLSVDSGTLSPILVPPSCVEITIWGIVTHVIHSL
jgi:DNA polymerase V